MISAVLGARQLSPSTKSKTPKSIFGLHWLGQSPSTEMGNTRDSCRYIKALSTANLGAITVGGWTKDMDQIHERLSKNYGPFLDPYYNVAANI